MTQANKAEFVLLLTAIGETFKREITATLIEVYWRIFEKYEFEQFRAAASAVLQKSEYFPAPATILNEITGTSEDNAIQAWEQVKTALRIHGAYETIVFEDGRIGAIIESFGGWPQFCMLKDTEIDAFKRAEFLKLYKAMAPREPKELPGLFEIQNSVRFDGYKREAKVFPIPGKQKLLK